jgi:hypothetical protein
MYTSTLDALRGRIALDLEFRERLRLAFGRTLATEGYLSVLSIEQVAALYALIFVPDAASSTSPS